MKIQPLAPLLLGLSFSGLACRAAVPDPEPEPEPIVMHGPHRTVAVARFDAIDSFEASHGSWDVGGGLSAMLSAALVESGAFVVVERAQLDHVLTEQELGARGLIGAGSAAPTGALAGAQYLVFGNVTEFGEEDSGSSFSLGLSGLFGGQGNAAVSPRLTEGSIAIDVRVVDTTTSEVVSSFTVREDLSRRGVALNVGIDDLAIGGETFRKTPLGRAARKAIQHVVARLASSVADRPWRGSVVQAKGDEAIINAGLRDGVAVGDSFQVQRVVDRLTDPDTGAALGERKQALGTLQVTSVDERVATATWTPSVVGELRRGDVVTTL